MYLAPKFEDLPIDSEIWKAPQNPIFGSVASVNYEDIRTTWTSVPCCWCL
jgi:hypothetical protein